MRTLRDDANNDTAFGLIAAAHNWRELRPGWCDCPPADELMEVFFRDPKTGGARVDVRPLPRDDANRMTHDLTFYLLAAVKSLWLWPSASPW
jgi:hypothetical protein